MYFCSSSVCPTKLTSFCFVALGLPTGKTTVMHLVPRESLPEPNSQGNVEKYL